MALGKRRGVRDRVAHLVSKLGGVVGASIEEVERAATGSLTIDLATGGGFPLGRLIEVFGPYSSGKTIILYTFLSQVQKAGGIAHLMLTEPSFDGGLATACGVDLSMLGLHYPKSLESVYRTLNKICISTRSEFPESLIGCALDSFAGTMAARDKDIKNPDADDNDEAGEEDENSLRLPKKPANRVGAHAQVNSKYLPVVNDVLMNTGAIFVLSNQARDDVGEAMQFRLSNAKLPVKSPGGWSLKHIASVRLLMNDGVPIVMDKDGESKMSQKLRQNAVGQRCFFEVEKNNTYPQWKRGSFDVVFGKGVQLMSGVLEFLKNDGLAKKRQGSKGQKFRIMGRKMKVSEILDSLESDTKFREELFEFARNRYRSKEVPGEQAEDSDSGRE